MNPDGYAKVRQPEDEMPEKHVRDKFSEKSAYDPRSPYSATKAGSDHLCNAWLHTFNLPIIRTNCSNNYGPYQFPEKLIPLCLLNILAGKKLPIYGDGRQVRDWLHVLDHCRGIDLVIERGIRGETYNIGGHNKVENIKVVKKICNNDLSTVALLSIESISLIVINMFVVFSLFLGSVMLPVIE